MSKDILTGRGASLHDRESLRLEGVSVCVGFDDILDVTLARNHPHFDTMIVVTSHEDRKTRLVCQKHGAICVPTDLFYKNERNFNKGAAINAGFNYFQYHGWRQHFDCDVLLPDNYRRILFNHTHLDRECLYGCDRIDVVGREALGKVLRGEPQHIDGMKIGASGGPISFRWADTLEGYLPLGFFQLWHCSCQKPYPYSKGTAAHDDLMFSALWPKHRRIHLPTVVCHHLCSSQPYVGQHWDGAGRTSRL